MSAKVIDFFSRRPITTAQDTEANDVHASGGRYIGNIGEGNAKAFRLNISVIESIYEQIAVLQSEVEDYENLHIEGLEYILNLLNAFDKFDLSTETLSVSEDGHVWIVPHEFPEE